MSGWRAEEAPNRSKHRNMREFEHFEGTRVVVLEGQGIDGSPVREVVHYFDEAGNRIAVHDPFTEAV